MIRPVFCHMETRKFAPDKYRLRRASKATAYVLLLIHGEAATLKRCWTKHEIWNVEHFSFDINSIWISWSVLELCVGLRVCHLHAHWRRQFGVLKISLDAAWFAWNRMLYFALKIYMHVSEPSVMPHDTKCRMAPTRPNFKTQPMSSACNGDRRWERERDKERGGGEDIANKNRFSQWPDWLHCYLLCDIWKVERLANRRTS